MGCVKGVGGGEFSKNASNNALWSKKMALNTNSWPLQNVLVRAKMRSRDDK